MKQHVFRAMIVLSWCGPVAAADNPTAEPKPAMPLWTVPELDKLPDDPWGRAVRHGRDLVDHTYALIGPEVGDPSHRFAGNNLACSNCHIDSGTKRFGLPFRGVYADFPNYRARSGTVGTIEDRVQGCMVRSMNGKRFPADSPDLTSIVAYLKFLSEGVEVGAKTPGRGAGRMPELDRAADPARGATIYAATCAACHGADGQGRRNGEAGDAKGYLFPPLWGADSFNNGAGMDRLINAANFIHANMPHGTTWDRPALSSADAWDVAAFVLSRPRPQKAALESDFPVRTEKPVDTPYGPYADDLSETQHRLGPFAAIRARLNDLRTEQTASPPQAVSSPQ